MPGRRDRRAFAIAARGAHRTRILRRTGPSGGRREHVLASDSIASARAAGRVGVGALVAGSVLLVVVQAVGGCGLRRSSRAQDRA
jgi:hypothetical protein